MSPNETVATKEAAVYPQHTHLVNAGSAYMSKPRQRRGERPILLTLQCKDINLQTRLPESRDTRSMANQSTGNCKYLTHRSLCQCTVCQCTMHMFVADTFLLSAFQQLFGVTRSPLPLRRVNSQFILLSDQPVLWPPNHTWINFAALVEECFIALSPDRGNVKHMKHEKAVIIVWELRWGRGWYTLRWRWSVFHLLWDTVPNHGVHSLRVSQLQYSICSREQMQCSSWKQI